MPMIGIERASVTPSENSGDIDLLFYIYYLSCWDYGRNAMDLFIWKEVAMQDAFLFIWFFTLCGKFLYEPYV